MRHSLFVLMAVLCVLMPVWPSANQPSSVLAAGTRGWEAIPGVIRNDGVETFRLEVDTNGPIASVSLRDVSAALTPLQAPPFVLHDDGLDGDRVAGDFIFTSGLFRYNPAFPMPAFYEHDPDSPAGLAVTQIGTIDVTEGDGSTTQFLIPPQIGVLRADVPHTTAVSLAPDMVIAPHLINMRTDTRETQRLLRSVGGDMRQLTLSIYAVLPDAFDFLVFFSIDKVEQLPRTSAVNMHAGLHERVQTNYTGTGLPVMNNATAYGSAGRLLSVNVLDAYSRGILSNNLTHELVHQWGAYIDLALGLSDGTVHYKHYSNVGSLVGGFRWLDNGDTTFTLDCDEGRNGAAEASPLDKYLMGLLAKSAVPPLHVYHEQYGPPLFRCAQVIRSDEIVWTVTIDDIEKMHGVRTPGPATAQRAFALAFVAESHGRLLHPTELTFYDMFAAHYTKPAALPGPYQGFNWTSISQFFGEGTTWSSSIPLPILAADLVTTAVSGPPASQNRDTQFSVTDTVRNQGGVTAASSSVLYYLSLDTSRDASDISFSTSRTVPSLVPGQTSTGSRSVKIPASTPLGTYFLLACADGKGLIAEGNETNNCLASVVRMTVTAPDLRAMALSNPPAAVVRGKSFNVTDTTVNAGTGPAGASLTRYYLSTDARKNSGDVLLSGSRAVPLLLAGATSTGTTSVTVPSGTSAKSYFLLACADDKKAVPESNEDDNCQASSTQVRVSK
jgi:hypothetical protein